MPVRLLYVTYMCYDNAMFVQYILACPSFLLIQSIGAKLWSLLLRMLRTCAMSVEVTLMSHYQA